MKKIKISSILICLLCSCSVKTPGDQGASRQQVAEQQPDSINEAPSNPGEGDSLGGSPHVDTAPTLTMPPENEPFGPTRFKADDLLVRIKDLNVQGAIQLATQFQDDVRKPGFLDHVDPRLYEQKNEFEQSLKLEPKNIGNAVIRAASLESKTHPKFRLPKGLLREELRTSFKEVNFGKIEKIIQKLTAMNDTPYRYLSADAVRNELLVMANSNDQYKKIAGVMADKILSWDQGMAKYPCYWYNSSCKVPSEAELAIARLKPAFEAVKSELQKLKPKSQEDILKEHTPHR